MLIVVVSSLYICFIRMSLVVFLSPAASLRARSLASCAKPPQPGGLPRAGTLFYVRGMFGAFWPPSPGAPLPAEGPLSRRPSWAPRTRARRRCWPRVFVCGGAAETILILLLSIRLLYYYRTATITIYTITILSFAERRWPRRCLPRPPRRSR